VTIYPTVKEVIAAHQRLIAKFGGSLGIRDLGALEAAVARPQTGYYEDVVQEAAALWEVFRRTTHSSTGISELPWPLRRRSLK
jgi:prophage maintenance system killer protein